MEIQIVLLVSVTTPLLVLQPVEGLLTSVAVRSIAWEEVKAGKQMTGSCFFKTKTMSHGRCALKCVEAALCRFFNFCQPNLCILNSDVFSIGRNLSLLEDSPTCTYHGMAKDEEPFCKDAGVQKDVQDDDSSGVCEINMKRVDSQWGPWENEVQIDGQDEFKEIQKRQVIVDIAHGGIQSTDDTERTKYWLKFVPDSVIWLKGKSTCESLGGKLFSHLDGTPAQLEFFVDKFGSTSMWMGLYRESAESFQYITTEGKAVPDDLIYWHQKEPSYGQDLYVVLYVNKFTKEMQYLHDALVTEPASPLCDLK